MQRREAVVEGRSARASVIIALGAGSRTGSGAGFGAGLGSCAGLRIGVAGTLMTRRRGFPMSPISVPLFWCSRESVDVDHHVPVEVPARAWAAGRARRWLARGRPPRTTTPRSAPLAAFTPLSPSMVAVHPNDRDDAAGEL